MRGRCVPPGGPDAVVPERVVSLAKIFFAVPFLVPVRSHSKSCFRQRRLLSHFERVEPKGLRL